MVTRAPDQTGTSLTTEAAGIRRNWAWFLTLGAVQIIAGAISVFLTTSTLRDSAESLGVLLLVAGAAQTAAALFAIAWDGFLLFLLLGIVYNVAGCFSLLEPRQAAESLPLLIASGFFIIGAHRIVAAMVENLPKSRWILSNGVLTMLLGLAIWRRWPAPGVATVRMLVGCELIANGLTWSVMAIGSARRNS
jgi:uncharacterized membrane protein HdeD (DUF308 family)